MDLSWIWHEGERQASYSIASGIWFLTYRTFIYDPALFVYHLVRVLRKMKMEEVVRNGFISSLKGIGQLPTPNTLRLVIQAEKVLLKIVKSITWNVLWRDC